MHLPPVEPQPEHRVPNTVAEAVDVIESYFGFLINDDEERLSMNNQEWAAWDIIRTALAEAGWEL